MIPGPELEQPQVRRDGIPCLAIGVVDGVELAVVCVDRGGGSTGS